MAKELQHVLPPIGDVEAFIKQVLKYDVPKFDVGGFVVGDAQAKAHLLGKSPGVVCGIPFAQKTFDILQVHVDWHVEEGHVISKADAEAKKPIAVVTGPVNRILLAERTVLNIMTRASGIASEATKLAEIKAHANWHGEVAGTRKTTPGFALVEKYALLVGGVSTHRLDLSSMVMLKDNHVWSVGSIEKAVRKARRACGFSTKIEVECRSYEEAIEACGAGAEIIMLDNYTATDLIADAEKIKAKYPSITIEASGGITEETIESYMAPSVDVISSGKLTQGYPALDFSLKIQR